MNTIQAPREPLSEPELSVTAVARKITVGFNYAWPWEKCGLYFGAGKPPGEFDPEDLSPNDPKYQKRRLEADERVRKWDTWLDMLRPNLKYLKNELDVQIVRIFLLCNTWNVGGVTRRASNSIFRSYYYDYDFPDRLHTKFFEHLTRMLEIFQETNMQAIPSLVDFMMPCERDDTELDPKTGKKLGYRGAGCRRQVVTDAEKTRRFLDMVLDPFLAASYPYRAHIFAWEVMNEPIWASIPKAYTDHPVDPRDMHAFLTSAITRIENYDRGNGRAFRSTVGHRFATDLSVYPTGNQRQFHFYPGNDKKKVLGQSIDSKVPEFNETNAFVGEFSVDANDDEHGGHWPELDVRLEQRTQDRAFYRLKLLEQKGYKLALLWPDRKGRDFEAGEPDKLKLTAEACEGIKLYRRS